MSIFALITAGVAGCTKDKPADTGPVGEIRIGLVTSLSGPDAKAGTDAEHGAQLALEIVNSDLGDLDLPLGPGAGLPRLRGAKVSIVTADTGGSADQAVAKAVELLSAGEVKALVTANSAEITSAVVQRTERVRVPVVDGRSSAGFLTSLGLDNFFRTAPADRDLGTSAYSLLRARGTGTRRIAIITAADASATTMVPALKDLAAEAGLDVAVTVEYPAGAADLTAAAQKVRAANPDAVLAFADAHTDAAAAVRAVLNKGAALPIIGMGTGFVADEFGTAIGTAGEGVFRVTPWSAQLAARQPISKTILDRYQQRFNTPMSDIAAGAFTATLTLASAINDAGAYEPDKVRVAMLATRLSGSRTIMPWDGVQFRENGQNTLASGAVEQLSAGKFQVVYPRELASAQVAWPAAEKKS